MPDDETLRTVTEYLHAKIPMTLAMGAQVTGFDGRRLTVEAPLTLNHNHLGTAFGGSLGALATLAGYALLWLELGDPGSHIVIRESSIKFRRPVTGNLVAHCRMPGEPAMDAFREDFARKGKARLELRVEIEEAGTLAVEFEGTFVALRS